MATPRRNRRTSAYGRPRKSLVPLEVTVWPSDLDSDACVGLTKEDFELVVGGKPRPIYAVDALGDLAGDGEAPRVEFNVVAAPGP